MRYRVTGVGPVPTDMLRYDRATVERSLTMPDRITTAVLSSDYPPSKDRWLSFGWTVAEVTEEE